MDNQQPRMSLTIMLNGGRLATSLLEAVNALAKRYEFSLYVTTMQNLRLIGVAEADLSPIREALTAAGAEIKGPGKFPQPRVCVGKPHCKLALVDQAAMAGRFWNRFGTRSNVKPKIKICFAACPASCSNALLADIGVVATRKGLNLYVGGKGGTVPKVGRRVLQQVDEERIFAAIDELMAYHDRKTGNKQRLYKLLAEPDFPFAVK